MQTSVASVENSMEWPQKTKIELPLDPVTPLLELYPKIRKHQFERTYAPLCS